jgi:two-component system chemotaxis response regulator CheY
MPDLITMDITMPELNGVDALKQIIALDKDAIIIMMTAIGKPQKVLECLDNGAKHFITKPLEAEKVLSAINQAMDIT